MDQGGQGTTAQVLDCTLRDGGYYCDWDFEDSTVRRYLDAVTASGVQYVEIGFRSRTNEGFAGKFKFCSDELVERLIRAESVKTAVMIDGKDFIDDGVVAHDDLARLFAPKSGSRVDIVRITVSPSILSGVVEIGKFLAGLGYEVSANLMQASVLSDELVRDVARTLNQSEIGIMYLADSFGGLNPARTSRLFEIVRESFSGRLGFHGHDNLGLALANSIAAMETGVDLIDSSLRGMGRGPGNLRTEQLLLYMRFHLGRDEMDVAPLFEVVSTEFRDLQDHYLWGMSLPYMLSSVYNIHPTFAQRLLQGERYSPIEVIRTLESLHRSESGARFDTDALTEALRDRFSTIDSPLSVTELPEYRPGLPISNPIESRPVLLLASGPSLHRHADAINDFVRKRNPIVVECNAHEDIEPGTDHYCVFTNSRRLDQLVHVVERARSRVVLGMPTIDGRVANSLQGKEIYGYPSQVRGGRFEASVEGCIIPHDVVAMTALAFSDQLGAGSIFVCGFDGYGTNSNDSASMKRDERSLLDKEMATFLRLFDESQTSGSKLISLTPTAFDLETQSIYGYL